MVRLVTAFILLVGFAALFGSAVSSGAAPSYPLQDVPTTFETPVEIVVVPVTARLLASCTSPDPDDDTRVCHGKVLVGPTPPLLVEPAGFAPRVASRPTALATAPDVVDLRPPRRAA